MQVVASLENPNVRQLEMAQEHTEIEDDDKDEGHRKVMHVHDPKLPSKAEVLEDQLTHLPYRTWCPHCIKGREKK